MHWITDNWHYLLPQPLASVALTFIAVLCGGLIGVERERKQKTVGFRTLVLVSLGSAVFTMITVVLDFRVPIAGQVVSGIGFLGAGVILRGPFDITGLNSAATIWATAAVGMTVGIGYAGAGLALSVFLLATMFLISLAEARYVGPCRYRWAVLTFCADDGKSAIRIEEVLDEFRFPTKDFSFLPSSAPSPAAAGSPPARGQMRLRYCDAHRHHREFLAFLAAMPEVLAIEREAAPMAA